MNLSGIRTHKSLILIPVLMALAFIIACGGTASEPTIIEREVVKEVIKEVPVIKEVIKEVPKEIIVEKEVIIEVVKQVIVIATPQPTSMPEFAMQPKQGGHIPMQTASANRQLDPHQGSSLSSSLTQFAPLYNMLLEYDPETDDPLDIRGDLAESWEMSADSLRYIFNLKENARWWDGKPVTAEDVVFSHERIADPDEPRPRAGGLAPFYKGSRALDEHTVELELPFASPLFLKLLALEYMKILPKHVLEAGVDISKISEYENVVGSGPFKIEKWKKDVSLTYVRNTDYFKEGYPRIDGMTHFIIKDHGTVIAAFKSGQVLMCSNVACNLTLQEADKLVADTKDKLRWVAITSSETRGIMLNDKVEPWDDVRVRHAIQLVMHRQPIIEILSQGENQLGGPFPPGFWFSRTEEELAQLPGYRELDGEKHPDDIAEARRLLAEAGFPNGFKTTMKVMVGQDRVAAAELAAEQLRKFLNIDATIKPGEIAAYYADYKAGNYALAIMGQGVLFQDPANMFAGLYNKDATRNYSGWSHPRMAEIYQEILREPDQEKRRVLAREADDFFINVDVPWVSLYWVTNLWVVESRIQNFHRPATVFQHIKHEHLWCDPAC